MQNRETSSPLQGVQHQVGTYGHDPSDCDQRPDERLSRLRLNGSRILANDMPTWVIRIDNTDLHVESAEARAIAGQLANRALGILEGSRVYHEQNPMIYIEEAMILWRKANDLEAALG